MKLFTLLQTKYSKFESVVKRHLSQTLSKYGTNYGNNTIFGQFMNVLGAAVQNLMLYIEDSMVEQNKYTAQRKKSIYGLAALAGYNPSLGQTSTVSLSMSYIPNNLESLEVIINNKEQLMCTQNSLSYCILLPQEAIVLSPTKDNSTRYITAVQGRFETQKFISFGGKYYTQNFSYIGNIDTNYLTVKINNEEWQYCPSFYDMSPDGKEWTYKISPIGGIDIVFGNDIHGRSLRDGDVIDLEYLIHDGSAGNLDVNSETFFIFNNPLKNINGVDVDGNSMFNITFSTDDAVSSGSDSESIEQVRNMIGMNSRSLVLASPDNYKAMLNKLAFCGYNRTWSERGSLIVNSLIMRNYKLLLNDKKTYYDLNEKDFLLTDAQKKSIKKFIQSSGHQLAGTTYNIFDPEICKYAMYVYLSFSSKNVDKEFIKGLVRKLIGNFFSEIQSDIFISKADIIQLLKNNIDGIDGVDVYFLSEKNETAIQTKQYTKTNYILDPITNTYKQDKQTIFLYDGEDPNLGLDAHGNIYLESDSQFPVLMGGWDYLNSDGDEVVINDPLLIIFE